MGMQKDGADAAVIAYFGDGATSQGDVNEAFICASVFNAPVVFFCQNNQWAISEPIERQTRIPLYQRALGFGFPGVRVDGNDVLAVLAVTRAALQNAREGNGPTLVEAFTYRMGAHTTSDDPTRYRLARRARGVEAQGPDRAGEGLPGPHRASPTRRSSTRSRRRPTSSPRTCARAASRCPTRSRCRSSTTSTPSGTRSSTRSGSSSRAYLDTFEERAAGVTDDADHPRQGHQRWACARRWRPTPRSSSWARTSASSAASSGSPTACRRTSARTGSSTPRSPSPASSAPRSAWRCAATGRCARSSSTASSTRRSTRSSASWRRCAPARSARCRCRSSSASRSAAASARSSTTASPPRPTSRTPPASRSSPAPTRSTPT